MIRVVALVAVVVANVTSSRADPSALAPPSSVEPIGEHVPEPTSELRLGGVLGNEAVTPGYSGTLAFMFGAGMRIGHSPLWIHGQIAGGESMAYRFQLLATGDYVQLQAGIELHACMHEDQVCFLLGQDFGYQHLDAAVPVVDTESDALLGVMRFGVEGGRDGHEALRIGLGLDLTETRQRITGGAMLLWLGYRFIR